VFGCRDRKERKLYNKNITAYTEDHGPDVKVFCLCRLVPRLVGPLVGSRIWIPKLSPTHDAVIVIELQHNNRMRNTRGTPCEPEKSNSD